MHLSSFVQIMTALAALCLGPSAGAAESSDRSDRHPADPTAPAARHEYRSTFADYQALPKDERKHWRSANEAVTGTRGNAGHAMPRSPNPSEASGEKQKPRQEGNASHRAHE